MGKALSLVVLRWSRSHPVWAGAACVAVVALAWLLVAQTTAAVPDDTVVTVRRGNLQARLTATGVLRPTQSITYRSPLAGREVDVTFLVPEGTLIGQGDLLVRLDTASLERDLERARQELRQSAVDLQMAEIEWQEGKAAVESLSEGEASLTIDETKTRLQLAERKATRLREEQKTLSELMEKGYITKEELRRTVDDLEQAERDLELAKRRTDVLVERTFPRDRRKAELQLEQKVAQRENVRARTDEIRARVDQLMQWIGGASIYAEHGGLVVYEEYLAATPRRKIRVGDRVTESQGLVTIPSVSSMRVETSVREADVQRVAAGQRANVVLEAFRDRALTGKVIRVGTVARSTASAPFEDKQFEVLVELDPNDLDLRPEMTARVDIVVGDRSGVLLAPVSAVFERRGVPVVHVVGPFGIETRAIQVGEMGDTMVEIAAGVAEGDRLALLEPPAADVPPGGVATPGAMAPAGGAGRGPMSGSSMTGGNGKP